MRRLTADNANQQRRIDALANSRLGSSNSRRKSSAAAHQWPGGRQASNGAGKQIMDDFQNLIGQMQDEELRLLGLREADDRRLDQTKAILILGTVLGLLVASCAGWSA